MEELIEKIENVKTNLDKTEQVKKIKRLNFYLQIQLSKQVYR